MKAQELIEKAINGNLDSDDFNLLVPNFSAQLKRLLRFWDVI